MVQATATIRNAAGIHCRPAAAIVKAMNGYAGQLTISTPAGSTDPRSIMGLLALGLEPGTAVQVLVDGPDEAATAARLVELLETHFDFPPRPADGEAVTALNGVPPPPA